MKTYHSIHDFFSKRPECQRCKFKALQAYRNSNNCNTPYASCKNPCQSTQQSSKYKPKDITYSSHDNTSPLKSSEHLINMISTISQPALRQNLKPVSIWIYNEIDSHRFIFEANTPHLFVLLVRCLIILRLKCQVKFAFTQIIWLWMIFKPGKFQLKITYIVAQIHNNKIIGSFLLTSCRSRASL